MPRKRHPAGNNQCNNHRSGLVDKEPSNSSREPMVFEFDEPELNDNYVASVKNDTSELEPNTQLTKVHVPKGLQFKKSNCNH